MYNLNICRSCTKNNSNINDINNCYVETLNAYQQNPSKYVNLENQTQNWNDCISKKMETLPYIASKPRNFCNFQFKKAPVFVNNDHYFPKLLNDFDGNYEKAFNECNNQCLQNRNKYTCQQNCQTDFNSLNKKN